MMKRNFIRLLKRLIAWLEDNDAAKLAALPAQLRMTAARTGRVPTSAEGYDLELKEESKIRHSDYLKNLEVKRSADKKFSYCNTVVLPDHKFKSLI